MLYLTCTTITSLDLAHYEVSRAKDWVSVDCGTNIFYGSFYQSRLVWYTLAKSRFSINPARTLGNTEKFTRMPFYLFLSSAALAELAKTMPAHCLTFCIHLFFCRPLLFSFIVPCKAVLAYS